MADISFDTGLVTFSLNGKCDVTFNPTDSNFIERLYKTFNDLDEKQEDYGDRLSKMEDAAAIFDFARERDKEMREMIDSLFDSPVCESLFAEMNVYAMANGLPVWCNLMLALMDVCDDTFAREQKATNPRVKKYTAKYQKSQKK